MALQGTLDTFALPDVLRLLAATKKTGRLRITGGRGTGSVWASSGEVVGLEATHAPHAIEPVDALFELLRFQDGAFTFDADATRDDPSPPTDVEILLAQSEALLDEWRSIEAVVPSMDAWVTLRPKLPQSEVVVDQVRWTTLVAVGGGATVRRVADELCLAELPISRAVKELVELGLVEIADTAPVAITTAPVATPMLARPLVGLKADDIPPPPPAPRVPTGPRARRAKAAAAPAEPDVFVPLDLPGQGPAPSYDQGAADEMEDDEEVAVEDLPARFPGLAGRSTPTSAEVDEEELASQLATLSPRAASAIRAAFDATTDEERDAALDEAVDGDEPLNRGLLLKFLSAVKS